MVNINKFEYLLKDISIIKGVGKKTLNILNKKKIFNVLDLLWKLPYAYEDRSKIIKIKDLHIGKVQTIRVEALKYNFPRKKNLPNTVFCRDNSGNIKCVFFNSYEGYIRKILPLNQEIIISGKINYYKKNYQITNPTYISTSNQIILKKHNKYSLSEGITNKAYNKIMEEILEYIPNLIEWHREEILKNFNYISWKQSIYKLHHPSNIGKTNENFYRRLAFDEIFSSMLISSEIRSKIKKIKNQKIFDKKYQSEIQNKMNFSLTADQKNALIEINNDLKRKEKMFRLLQGDVGCGKTVVALISAINVIESGYQVCFMAPTEILAKQHYSLAKKIFPKNVDIFLLTGSTSLKEKKIY